MKKSVVVLFVFLLMISAVYAADEPGVASGGASPSPSASPSVGAEAEASPSGSVARDGLSVGEIREDLVGGLRSAGGEARTGLRRVFEEKVEIPEGLRFFAKVMFGVEDREVDFSEFIVLVCLWIVMFIVIAQTLSVMPILNKGFQKWLGALIVVCLIGFTGALMQVVDLYFDFANFIGILEKYGLLKVFVGIVIILILLFGSMKVIKSIERREEKNLLEEKAEMAGSFVDASAESVRKISGG